MQSDWNWKHFLNGWLLGIWLFVGEFVVIEVFPKFPLKQNTKHWQNPPHRHITNGTISSPYLQSNKSQIININSDMHFSVCKLFSNNSVDLSTVDLFQLLEIPHKSTPNPTKNNFSYLRKIKSSYKKFSFLTRFFI